MKNFQNFYDRKGMKKFQNIYGKKGKNNEEILEYLW